MSGLEPGYPYGISSNTCFGSVWGAHSALSLLRSRQLSEQQQQFEDICATAVSLLAGMEKLSRAYAVQCQKCKMKEGRGNSGIVGLAILATILRELQNFLALPRKMSQSIPLHKWLQAASIHSTTSRQLQFICETLGWQCRITSGKGRE